MKVTRLLLWTGSVAAVAALAVEPPSLSIQNSTNGAVVNVESPGVTPVVGTAYHLRFESSTDLRAWRDQGDWDTLAPGGGDDVRPSARLSVG